MAKAIKPAEVAADSTETPVVAPESVAPTEDRRARRRAVIAAQHATD